MKNLFPPTLKIEISAIDGTAGRGYSAKTVKILEGPAINVTVSGATLGIRREKALY